MRVLIFNFDRLIVLRFCTGMIMISRAPTPEELGPTEIPVFRDICEAGMKVYSLYVYIVLANKPIPAVTYIVNQWGSLDLSLSQ